MSIEMNTDYERSLSSLESTTKSEYSNNAERIVRAYPCSCATVWGYEPK